GLSAFLLGTVAAAGISIASLDASAASPAKVVAAVEAQTDATTPPSTDSGTDASSDKPARAEETPLTGDDATKVEAAVKAAQPDATIERMETDADGAAFEAHITLADGSHATVKLDANYTVTGTETGGPGGPGGGHGRGRGHGPKDCHDTTTDSTTDTATTDSGTADSSPTTTG
ncbi:MAG TPA: hypothetical protein PKV27_08750, partial [Ilumatobacteraceae bacterium]|nr:hypothetical protein [Ilumatobacteraceae bacterium]